MGKTAYLENTNNDKHSGALATETPEVNASLRLYANENKIIQRALLALPEYAPIVASIPDDKTWNRNGSGMNRILCYYENIILGHGRHVLNTRNIEVCVFMFDGLMGYGNHYEDVGLLAEIESYVESQVPGLGMEWNYKKHDTIHSVPADFDEHAVKDESRPEFADAAVEFEKAHALIINKSLYVHETNESTIFMTERQMTTSFKHMGVWEPSEKEGDVVRVGFIGKWMNNDGIRKYDDADVYPHAGMCPSNIYNLWRPFAMEKYKDIPYEPNEEGKDMFLHHIRILCSHDEVVYDWFIKWIAQMLQFPEVKTVIPTFVSKPGTGKNTLIELLSRLMGRDKVMETTDPARDVWGSFNGMMATSFLVHLNEMSKKDYREAEGRFKGLITDPTITINSKGVNQYKVKSYHRFIGSTNNEDPLPTTVGDRRNVVIRCSDEKIGDTAYFEQLYAHLEDVNVLRALYDYFMSVPDMDMFHKQPLPATEFQNDMKSSNRSPIEQWLEAFVMTNSHKDVVTLMSTEVFGKFTGWVDENKVPFEVTSSKFHNRLKNLNVGITTEHTRGGNAKVFNIPALLAHFGLEPPPSCGETTGEEEVEYELELEEV